MLTNEKDIKAFIEEENNNEKATLKDLKLLNHLMKVILFKSDEIKIE